MLKFGKRRGASARAKPTVGQSWTVVWRIWLRWLGVAVVLGGLGTGLYAGVQQLMNPELFPLRHVLLRGTLRNLTEADMKQAVTGYLGQNFFTLNIDALHTAFASNPWIEKVTVHRRWPDTLEVRFRERTAFGYWGRDEMVDINGQRFRPPVLRQPGPWPHLAGPDGHELNVIQTYRETNVLLNKVDLHLTQLVQDERRAWEMTFTNGLQLKLGKENFAQRLQRFIDVYPRVLASQIDKIEIVDLRYVNGFAVRWKNLPAVKVNVQRNQLLLPAGNEIRMTRIRREDLVTPVDDSTASTFGERVEAAG